MLKETLNSSDIEKLLHEKANLPSPEELETIHKMQQLYADFFSDSPKPELHAICKDDTEKMIEYLDPHFRQKQKTLNRQVSAVEEIAQTAKLQADQALKQAIISEEKLALTKEQVEAISSIACDAKSQADTTRKELEIMKGELRIAKETAASSEKDATFSKVVAILAIVISIIVPVLTEVIAPLLLLE